jgi:hypothetical protein
MRAAPPSSRQVVGANAGLASAVAIGTHDPSRASRVNDRAVAPLPGVSSSQVLYKRSREVESNMLRAQLQARVSAANERARHQAVALAKREHDEEKADSQLAHDLQKEDPACMGSTAAMSTQEMNPDEKKFVDTLQGGTRDRETGETRFKGLMRKTNMLGQPNLPYTHQRNVVRTIASKKTTMYVVAHDPGLGKTATALMAYCAEACMLERVPKMLISVPSATLDQWQDAVGDWIKVSAARVMVTSKLAEVTREVLRSKDIIILSKDCVARAYATCFQHYEKHSQIETGPGLRWISKWDRIGIFEGPAQMPPLHCLFEPPNEEAEGWYGHWDLMVYDEVHTARNPDSRLCEAHAEIAHLATKRIGLTGTPLVNKTGDFGGIAKALDAPITPINFQSKQVWCVDRNFKKVNRETVRAFTHKSLFHRASDKILNLPPIIREAVNYQVMMPADKIAEYNDSLMAARNLKTRIERAGRATAADLQRLMAMLQVMQQMVVSPLLAEHGAAKFKSEQELFVEASANRNATGAFFALRDEIRKLHDEGHRQIVIAASHTSIMKIVRMWITRNHPEFGHIFCYDGELSQRERLRNKKGFLQSGRALMFLSVSAGGVGLHLVPGCEAMIFWGSLAFSPAHLTQCMKRIHRIGQLCPITTAMGKPHVAVRYLVPYGSVDGAIGTVHEDKDRLMKLCMDGDNSGFGNEEDDNWRKHARIVDEAQMLGPDGNFPPMPMTKAASDGTGDVPFTLLPDVQTRGVPSFEAKPPQHVGVDRGSSSAGLTAAQAASQQAANLISLDSDDE